MAADKTESTMDRFMANAFDEWLASQMGVNGTSLTREARAGAQCVRW